jgi:hypothetical protein
MEKGVELIKFLAVFLLPYLLHAQVIKDSKTTLGPDKKPIVKSKRIEHPQSKEGLYLIDEESVYHYKVPTKSGRDYSLFFRFISTTAPEITTTINGSDLSYGDFYGSGNLTGLDFIYEWQPFKSFGKAGIQFGGGLAVASGRGYFASGDNREPLEGFTLFSIPVFAGIIYRFEFVKRQWFVPYATGGLIYNALIEYRDDGDNNIVGAPAGYGGGGLLINLTALNKRLAFIMDREYGFSNLWLSAEFRRNESFNEDLNISSDQISVGLGADY